MRNLLAMALTLSPTAALASPSTDAFECRFATSNPIPVTPTLKVARTTTDPRLGFEERWYETAGLKLFGFPVLFMGHHVQEDAELNGVTHTYTSIVDGTMDQIRFEVERINRDIRCKSDRGGQNCRVLNPVYDVPARYLSINAITSMMEAFDSVSRGTLVHCAFTVDKKGSN